MKNNILGIALMALTVIACNKKETTTTEETTKTTDTIKQPETDTAFQDAHTSQNSLDWFGTYEATLPCADCPGIKTTVTLNKDETFTYVSEYLERDTKIEEKGKIMWHDNGSVVHLKGKDIDTKLKVIENGLIALDQEGKVIDGPLKEHYNFKKIN